MSHVTGSDIQRWNYCLEKAQRLGITVIPDGDVFRVSSPKSNYGLIVDVESVFQFLCGFEWGVEVGKMEVLG